MEHYTPDGLRKYAKTIINEGDKSFYLAMADIIEQRDELLAALDLAIGYIDAIPKDAQLGAMPGFDRDWVDTAIANAKGA